MNFVIIFSIMLILGLVVLMIFTFTSLQKHKKNEKTNLLNTMRMKNDFDIDDGSYITN